MPLIHCIESFAAAHPELTTCAALSAAYNALTVSVSRPLIARNDFLNWGASGPLAEIETASTDTTKSIAVRAICLSILDASMGSESFDASSTSNQANIATLVSAGVLTSDQSNALFALSTVSVPQYTQPGEWGVLTTAADFTGQRSS
jgi:hypothetical protein